MKASVRCFVVALILTVVSLQPGSVSAHGRLTDPPGRSTAWRYGFKTPVNYDDNGLNCGGFTRQWERNRGRCGVCGDPWDSPVPRQNEYGGKYGRGVIVKRYETGAEVTLQVQLTASHKGYFTFSVCKNYKKTGQECLDKHILRTVHPQPDREHSDTRYYPAESRTYEMRYKLPPKFQCPHCVLQWRYIGGNNWGPCPNGTEATGCGPQEEFRACADISILEGKNINPVEENGNVAHSVQETEVHKQPEEVSCACTCSNPRLSVSNFSFHIRD